MSVIHYVGSLAAELKLSAILNPQSPVIRSDLCWYLQKVDEVKSEPKQYTCEQAQAFFSVVEGEYQLTACYREKQYKLGLVSLARNTLTDKIFILEDFAAEMMPEYFVDYSVEEDFARRCHEREEQLARYGAASFPLRDPRSQESGELGVQILAHPLFAQAKQLDGIPPEMSPDPSENREALQLTLAAAATPTAAPGMSGPRPG